MKIAVFLFTVLTLVVIIGALMYVIEGAENGFTSIPMGFVASLVMILGYGIIAVPTGELAADERGQHQLKVMTAGVVCCCPIASPTYR